MIKKNLKKKKKKNAIKSEIYEETQEETQEVDTTKINFNNLGLDEIHRYIQQNIKGLGLNSLIKIAYEVQRCK